MECLASIARTQRNAHQHSGFHTRVTRAVPDSDSDRDHWIWMLDSLLGTLRRATESSHQVQSTLDAMNIEHWHPDDDKSTNDETEGQNNRTGRALFEAGGKLLSSLFGLVTSSEARSIRQGLRVLSENQNKISGRMLCFEKQVVALANVSSEHIKELEVTMAAVDGKFKLLFSDLSKGFQATARMAALTSSLILTLMQDISIVQGQIQSFLEGLRALMKGELSVDLVSEGALRRALSDLDLHIQTTSKTFSVAERDPLYYYKSVKPVYSWRNSTLIVYLSVPLKSTDTAFRLYRVTTFGVPVETNNTLITRPILEKNIFGISLDQRQFLEMDASDLETCTRARTIRCQHTTVIHDVFHSTCSLAIFQNNEQSIKKHCSYRLESVKPVMSVTPLSPGRLLISHAHTITVTCQGKSLTRPACEAVCLWKQACNCIVTVTDDKSRSLVVPPVNQGCLELQHQYEIEYPVNIPALSRLLSPQKLVNISHDSYVKSITDIPRPDINVHPLARGMNMNDKYHFSIDLDEAVQQLRQDSILSPFELEDYKSSGSSDGWAKYITVSLGLVLLIIIIVIPVYMGYQRSWFKVRPKASIDPPSPPPPIPQPSAPSEQHITMVQSPYGHLRTQVATIIGEYANEMRATQPQTVGHEAGPTLVLDPPTGGPHTNGPPVILPTTA